MSLFAWDSPEVGLPGLSDFVDRYLTHGKDQIMYLLEPMSAEPIASLYESADQQLPQTQLRRVSDRYGDADDAGSEWMSE